MTRVPLLIAFAAGTGCGFLLQRTPAPPPPPTHPAPTRTIVADAAPPPHLHSGRVVVDAVHQFARNLFAFREPPPAPRVEPAPSLRTVPVTASIQPYAPQPPTAPPFPYRYIGTFGPRENAFAVFTRDGEVINARIGDAVGEHFRLRRIGLESVDLAWAGPGEVRVGVGR